MRIIYNISILCGVFALAASLVSKYSLKTIPLRPIGLRGGIQAETLLIVANTLFAIAIIAMLQEMKKK